MIMEYSMSRKPLIKMGRNNIVVAGIHNKVSDTEYKYMQRQGQRRGVEGVMVGEGKEGESLRSTNFQNQHAIT
jgi:hypothetical protein